MKSMLIPLRCQLPCLEDNKMPSQKTRTLMLASLVGTALALFTANLVRAEDDPVFKTKDVILIHGAWADGSSWSPDAVANVIARAARGRDRERARGGAVLPFDQLLRSRY